ncbi:hypothetical protein FSP39_008616 [Pinctada imbricata]|uniref:Oxidoreductase-like domain-containing protein n=1 Tax=Pinctada imbricata TaxID=66713 RepID=A0AA89BT35_PINIB|nr:hypothetical protein FSP39_008616 [Pinctada imbricata]
MCMKNHACKRTFISSCDRCYSLYHQSLLESPLTCLSKYSYSTVQSQSSQRAESVNSNRDRIEPCGTPDSSLSSQDADKDIKPSLSAITRDDTTVETFSEIIPGKGPPPELPVNCCMSGCANCVWITYAEELQEYYRDGGARALKEINKLENEGLKAFLKLELGLK